MSVYVWISLLGFKKRTLFANNSQNTPQMFHLHCAIVTERLKSVLFSKLRAF